MISQQLLPNIDFKQQLLTSIDIQPVESYGTLFGYYLVSVLDFNVFGKSLPEAYERLYWKIIHNHPELLKPGVDIISFDFKQYIKTKFPDIKVYYLELGVYDKKTYIGTDYIVLYSTSYAQVTVDQMYEEAYYSLKYQLKDRMVKQHNVVSYKHIEGYNN